MSILSNLKNAKDQNSKSISLPSDDLNIAKLGEYRETLQKHKYETILIGEDGGPGEFVLRLVIFQGETDPLDIFNDNERKKLEHMRSTILDIFEEAEIYPQFVDNSIDLRYTHKDSKTSSFISRRLMKFAQSQGMNMRRTTTYNNYTADTQFVRFESM